jgi:hypothetical protein
LAILIWHSVPLFKITMLSSAHRLIRGG